jgi:EAL domain-containing protein (putative c-di-GMP-specific phosphodiesterase class I)
LVNDDNRDIVQAVIQIAKTLKIKTIAEGVEDKTLANELKLMGCDEAQGYLYARPLAADELMGWLSDYHQDVTPSSPSLHTVMYSMNGP